jgi:hypothetical protein
LERVANAAHAARVRIVCFYQGSRRLRESHCQSVVAEHLRTGIGERDGRVGDRRWMPCVAPHLRRRWSCDDRHAVGKRFEELIRVPPPAASGPRQIGPCVTLGEVLTTG